MCQYYSPTLGAIMFWLHWHFIAFVSWYIRALICFCIDHYSRSRHDLNVILPGTIKFIPFQNYASFTIRITTFRITTKCRQINIFVVIHNNDTYWLPIHSAFALHIRPRCLHEDCNIESDVPTKVIARLFAALSKCPNNLNVYWLLFNT